MAILDIFKKKKEKKEEITKPVKEVKPKKEVVKPAEKREEVKEEKPKMEVISDRKIKEKKAGESYRVLKFPHITEKATALSEKNQYTFKILPKTNKAEIKRAIENLYGVNVLSVKIIKVPRKKRRLGRISGFRKGYKKAIVGIEKGQKIEVLPR